MSRIFPSKLRLAIWAGAITGLIASSIWLRAQLSDTRSVSELMPPGALLYIEAKDFRALLSDWNGSNEKSRWLASANRAVLSESRLVQRLSQAEGEFADIAGIPIGMPLLDQIAGTRSGFAFYNLSALSFVYLTQMQQNRIEDMGLWRERSRYTRREVAGIPFYLKSEDGTRTVAFTSYKDWFLVATDENLAAETLILLSGRKDASLATGSWFRDASKQPATPGDLRLVYNLTALIATPQFRTYWLQRNVTELKAFSAGISDLSRQNDGFEEQRTMLRKTEIPVVANDASLREALAYAPPSDSLYRAWSMPGRDTIAESLQQLVSGEQVSAPLFNPPAPDVTPEASDVGTEADLEIQIDEPPFQRASQTPVTPLVDAVLAMQPTALLHVQATRVLRDQVFVMPASGLVIVCKQPDRAALDRALAQVSGPLGSGILDALHVEFEGNTILLTRLNLSRGSNTTAAVPSDATYVAVYNHAGEWPRYKKLFAILDRTPTGPEAPASPNSPPFFSANVQSLGDSLPRLQKASIFSADRGAVIHETVKYQLARP